MIIFNKQERKEITEAIKKEADELYNIYSHCTISKISVDIKGNYYLNTKDGMLTKLNARGNCKLVIYEDEIYITDPCQKDKIYLVANGKFITSRCQIYFNNDAEFIRHYATTKKSVLNAVKNCLNKDELMQEIQKETEAAIVVDFPESNSKNKIEITKEDGRTVGIIDFGDRVIKIITNSDIILVDRTKEQNQSLEKKKV